MNRFPLLLALVIAGVLCEPVAPAAATMLPNYTLFAPAAPANSLNLTYTFSVPVNLSHVAAPAGTTLQVQCAVSSSVVQPNYISRSVGTAATPPLNASGAASGNVLVSVHAVNPMTNYTCTVLPGATALTVNVISGTM